MNDKDKSMDDEDKSKLYLITILLDLGLIYLCTKKNLPSIDKLWCYITLILHLIFYYGLYHNKTNILKTLHYFIFILPFLSTFTNTVYPKILSLFLLITIQFLWVIENRCILKQKGETFGYGGAINIATITLSTILSFQIGKLI